MIGPDQNPVQWVLLMDELSEAHEHLGKLLFQMQAHAELRRSRVYASTWATSWRI